MNIEEFNKVSKELDKEKEDLLKKVREIEDKRRAALLSMYSVDYVGKYIKVDGTCNSLWMKVKSQKIISENTDADNPTIMLYGEGFTEYLTMKEHQIRFDDDLTYSFFITKNESIDKWIVTNNSIKEISEEDFKNTAQRLVDSISRSYC